VSWSATAARLIDTFVGFSTLGVFVSLNHTLFSTYWPGNYEFYAGGESAFGARGYPVEIAIRLIVVVCLVVIGSLTATAALRAFGREFRWLSEQRRRRVLAGLTVANVGLILVALTLPPRGMVVFPPIQLSRGAYVGLLAAALAALAAGGALLLPNSSPL